MLETIREFAAEQSTRVGRRGSATEASRRVPQRSRGYARAHPRGGRSGCDLSDTTSRSPSTTTSGPRSTGRSTADPVLGLRLATALENYWISYGPFEASRMFEELVARADDMPDDLEALATRCRGDFAIFTDDRRRGLQLYEESLEQYRRSRGRAWTSRFSSTASATISLSSARWSAAALRRRAA